MRPNLSTFDRTVFHSIEKAEQRIEEILDSDVIYYLGNIQGMYIPYFRNTIEHIKESGESHDTLSICLTTLGGEVEVVEKMVEIVRKHYKYVYFIVPNMAMSAGTIFCMSGNRIYMDYASSLGPIDPQVINKEEIMVPALGYLDKVEEYVKKSLTNDLSPAEFAQLDKLDLAMLRRYEQARELSQALLKQWLVKYKFAEWQTHSNLGTEVTKEEKEKRAKEVASDLSNNRRWHSHGRMIGMQTVRDELKLQINDFAEDDDLHSAIRTYNDMLADYATQRLPQPLFIIYNRNIV